MWAKMRAHSFPECAVHVVDRFVTKGGKKEPKMLPKSAKPASKKDSRGIVLSKIRICFRNCLLKVLTEWPFCYLCQNDHLNACNKYVHVCVPILYSSHVIKLNVI